MESCRFCHKRFFDEKALVAHLESSHQHCIFCPPEAHAVTSCIMSKR